MNILRKTILHACWQKEIDHGMHAARPWLRWFLARVVGVKGVPVRQSETKQRTREQWLAVRKEAALKIDPETAEVFCVYGDVCDPYGVYNLPGEACIGRNYFARSPENDVWISFDDLPDAVCDRLWARMRAGEFKDKDNDLVCI